MTGAGGRIFRDIFRRWLPRVCLGVRVTSTPQSQRKGSARVVRGLWTAGPGLGHVAPPGATGVGKCHGPCSQPHPTGASSTGTITGAVSDGPRGLREDRACGAHDGAGTPSCGCNPRTRQSKAYNRGIFYFKDHENEVSTAGPATQGWKQNLADGFESPPYPRPEPPVCPQPLLSFRCPENPELGAGAGFPALRQWRRAARLPRVVSLLQVVPGVHHVFTRLRSVDLHGGRCLSTPQLPHPSPWGATAGRSRFWRSSCRDVCTPPWGPACELPKGRAARRSMCSDLTSTDKAKGRGGAVLRPTSPSKARGTRGAEGNATCGSHLRARVPT